MFRPRSNIYYDPSPAIATPGGGAPAAPAPAAASPASPGTPAPAAPAPASNEPPALPHNAYIEMAPGQRVGVTQLIEDAKRALPPDEMKAYELFKRVRAGDPEAYLEVAGIQRTPAQPETPKDPNVAALEAKIGTLEETLKYVAPTVQQIELIKEGNAIASSVTKHSEKLPYLAYAAAKIPGTLEKVHGEYRSMLDQARAMNKEIDHNQAAKNEILAYVLTKHENEQAAIANGYGFKVPTTAPQGTTAQAVGANGQPIPARIPSPGAPGTSLSPTTFQPEGKFDTNNLLERMRASSAARQGV